MGEMIKFGIKIGLVVSTAIALMAALAILFSLTSESLGYLNNVNVIAIAREFAQLFGLFLPIPARLIFSLVASLGTFKVAYWAADKMIEFINALG